MTINPTISFWAGIAVTAFIGISGGTVHLTNAIPSDWIPFVTSWSSILAFIGSAAITAAHGYSSGQSGPLVQK